MFLNEYIITFLFLYLEVLYNEIMIASILNDAYQTHKQLLDNANLHDAIQNTSSHKISPDNPSSLEHVCELVERECRE